jgi:sugar phosphate permease
MLPRNSLTMLTGARMDLNSGERTSNTSGQHRPTRVRYLVLAVGCTFALLTYVQRQGFVRATTDIMADLNLTKAQIGDLASVFLVAYGIFMIPCGWMSDRLGARKLLTILVLGWSVMTGATMLAAVPLPLEPFTVLVAVRFLFGAFQAGAFPVWARVMTDWMTVGERATGQGVVWMCSRLGGAVGPYLYFGLARAFGTWTTPFACLALLGVVWAAGFWLWFRNRPEEMPAVNDAERALISSGRAAPAVAKEPVPWKALLTSVNVWALCLLYGFTGFSGNFITNLLPTYLHDDRNLSDELTTRLTSLPLIFGIAACFAGGILSDTISHRLKNPKWGRRVVPMVGLSLAGLSVATVPWVEATWLMALLLAGSFFFNDLNIAPAWAACADVGERYAGTISGAMNMTGQFIGAIGTSFAGRMLKQGEARLLFVVFGCSYALATLCWLAVDVTRPLRVDRTQPMTADES